MVLSITFTATWSERTRGGECLHWPHFFTLFSSRRRDDTNDTKGGLSSILGGLQTRQLPVKRPRGQTFSPVKTCRASLTTAKCPRPSVLSRSYSPAIFPSRCRFSPAMIRWTREVALVPACLLTSTHSISFLGGGSNGFTVDCGGGELRVSGGVGSWRHMANASVQFHFVWEREREGRRRSSQCPHVRADNKTHA